MVACGVPPTDAPAAPRALQRERVIVLIAALALVVFRTLAYLIFDTLHFNSDQAIVGLMAKHLSEGRALPLFFYGQPYMLAVEAWAMVPFFWLAGPTVAALRASMLAWNLAAAALLVTGLERWGGLRPRHALVASLFFVLAPPAVAVRLIEAQGGIIEPFVYVMLLWALRDRPAWFGLVLGVGFLNREFTLYAVPVIAAAQIAARRPARALALSWLVTAVVFVAVWESIEALKPFADLAGPGTRAALAGDFTVSQIDNLLARPHGRVAELPARLVTAGREVLAWTIGARLTDMPSPAGERPWLGWILGAAGVAAAARLGLLSRQRHAPPAAFAWYLLGVGLVAIAGFAAAGQPLEGHTRYAVLAAFAPAGFAGVCLALEPRAAVRTAVAAVVVAWASIAALDHGRLFAGYRASPPAAHERELADGLVARGIAVAEASYWRAYEVTFLARERVKVASTEVVRIEEYQRLAASARGLVAISDAPCPGGERVAIYYLCRHDP
jgi:hypothetical protein